MKYLALVAALVSATPAGAWGPIGHRVTAELADHNINGRTRAQVALILGTENLAEAATWPDEQRSNPAPFWQETSSPWHYVTLPEGRTADQLEHPTEGDAATALAQFTATLRDPSASQEEKATALRFVVHLVSDLHQPLHVGNGTDRGGNDFKVSFFDQPTNLHWVWDEGIIKREQLSYTELANRLGRRMTPQQAVEWWQADPAVWMAESAALRDRIYPATGGELGLGTLEAPAALSYDYEYAWRTVIDRRLAQAGMRTAAYLDWVFSTEQ